MALLEQITIVIDGITHTGPTSISQADAWKAILLDEIADIETQLGDRNRVHPDGSRLTSEEYYQWRSGATRALNVKKAQLRRLKAVIRELRERAREVNDGLSPDDPDDLLKHCLRIIKQGAANGLELNEHDQQVVDTIKRRFYNMQL